ncbi:nitroreductase [Pseudomonas duriflava]|uniref:Nitroreductase n=1 Tax=Pseudomonas duriflava TaxID=459528 RepID=A0A562QLG9_9PSED|nr:nitroreductase family protein [Pseudomonas duriflava]TWI57628.1 nitroreductase [Pseudomonas duriflava]
MNTLDTINARRAVRHYDPTHQLSDEEQHQLFTHALLAPTSFNLQHVRLVAVTDPALRQQLRAVAWDQAHVTDSSLLVVICADMASWEKNAARIWREAPQAVQDFMVPAIDAYYRDKPQVQRDEAMRSSGLVAQTLMLAAKAMGYDSCPMVGFDFDAVGKLINLPEDHVVGLMVAIGKGVEPAHPRIGKLPYDEVVIRDRF